MMSSTTSLHPLASLLRHGKTLATLLHMAETREGSDCLVIERENIHEEVKAVITELLVEFSTAHDQASIFPKKSVANLLKKIEEILEKFIKFDPDYKSEYESFAKRVINFKAPTKFYAEASSDGCSDSYHEASVFQDPQDDVSATFGNLTPKEKDCLICLSLFPTTHKGIKKRELIHWWVGMNLVDDLMETDDMLGRLLSLGFIERAVRNNWFNNQYKMNDSVCSKLQEEMSAFWSIEKKDLWCIMLKKPPPSSTPVRSDSTDSVTRRKFVNYPSFKIADEHVKPVPEALLNIGENVLNPNTHDLLSKIKHIKVLHLGSWQHDPTNYIVVEDIEVLRDLKHLVQTRFLSLQGVSGIVKLPDSVCKLENLRVLDLRACHNLESLPEGIDSLKKLTHLDLSECYLLHQVPNGIASLSELRVLKGFIINQDSSPADAQVIGRNRKGKIASSCAFGDLSKLQQLKKLTIRTRRMNFPTKQDLETLCLLEQLKNLSITWIGSPSDALDDRDLGIFPVSLNKLELQAAPETTTSSLLRLISKQRVQGLEKFYIRGGGISELGSYNHCFTHLKVVSLKYLTKLHIHWNEFQVIFPSLTRLEICGCPNLIFFPCDENGVWEHGE